MERTDKPKTNPEKAGRVVDDSKKPYAKPSVESDSAFEVLSAGCGLADPLLDAGCDPEFGGYPASDSPT